MSKHSADASEGVQRKVYSAYDDPGTAEEMSRRTFMANATTVIGGIVGITLAIPIVGSLLPVKSDAIGNWAPLTADELAQLQKATQQPVKLTFTLKSQDSYLPAQAAQEYVWGIKVENDAKFKATRPDIFGPGVKPLPYDVINMSFVIFSPICPHLGCRFDWHEDANKFLCPCHGSQFTFDGEHIAGQGPAPRGLDPLPLREQNGVADIMWIRYKATVPDRIVISYQS